MKNLILLIVAILAFSTLAIAQVDQSAIKKDVKNINKEESALKQEKKAERKQLRKLNGMEVSYQAKQQFQADFPKVTDAHWKRTTNFDEAAFTNNGKEMKAYYDDHSKLVGTSNDVTFAELPQRAQKYIHEKYPDYSIGPAVFFDDNEFNETDMVLYGLQFDDEDSYFVELAKDGKKIVARSNSSGDVFFFKDLK
jgi:uncharacterized protein YxeA